MRAHKMKTNIGRYNGDCRIKIFFFTQDLLRNKRKRKTTPIWINADLGSSEKSGRFLRIMKGARKTKLIRPQWKIQSRMGIILRSILSNKFLFTGPRKTFLTSLMFMRRSLAISSGVFWDAWRLMYLIFLFDSCIEELPEKFISVEYIFFGRKCKKQLILGWLPCHFCVKQKPIS